MTIAILQLPPLAPSDIRLKKYLQTCKKQKAQCVAFAEYVFYPFYREIDKVSKSFHKECAKTLNSLVKLSAKYKFDIIAPVIICKDSKVYKSIALFSQGQTHIYNQQRLITYEHWNEKQFFDNTSPKSFKTPLIFEKEGLKFAIIAGFEVHFDEIWLKLKHAGVDVVIMPCSNTFSSKERWRILTQARAFSNTMVVLRINRLGEVSYDGVEWNFYGDSLFVNANGCIEDTLEEREGVLLIELQASQIKNMQSQWGFRE